MSDASLFSFLVAAACLCLAVLTAVITVVGFRLLSVLEQLRRIMPDLEGASREAHIVLKRLRKISKRGSRISEAAEGTVLAVCASILDIAGGIRGVNEVAQTFIQGCIGNGHRSGRSRTQRKK